MTRATLILTDKAMRDRARKWIDQAPPGTRVEFKKPVRSLPQNDIMWALLGELAAQLPYHGIKITPEDYKLIFLDALSRENLRLVPNIDGNGFVALGRSSSKLSKEEMSNMIELIMAFGARNGVVFKDQPSEALSRPLSASAAGEVSPMSPASSNQRRGDRA